MVILSAHRIPSKHLPNVDAILVRTNIMLISWAVADPFAYFSYYIISIQESDRDFKKNDDFAILILLFCYYDDVAIQEDRDNS